jgi:hypothetical protein
MQRTRRVYTGSSLRRVKPYVQFFGLFCLGIAYLVTRVASLTLYLASGWARFPDSWSLTTRRPKSSWFTSLAISCRSALVEIHRGLVLYAKSWGCDGLCCLGNLLEGLQKFVWAANKVGWAHWQVGRSSGRPDPLIEDGREPDRWRPKGTHVSQR